MDERYMKLSVLLVIILLIVSFVMSGFLWLRVQDLENRMAPTDDGADSLQDLEDKIEQIEAQIDSLGTETSVNMSDIKDDINSIRDDISTLNIELGTLIARLNALESFLEHHVIEVFVEGIRPFTPDCTIAQNPCTIYFDVTINGTLYTTSLIDIQRTTATDKVWLNWTKTYKNAELGKKIPIDFGIRWIGGGSSVLDIDNSSDSTLVSVIYDVVSKTWTGDDPEMDGFTTGVDDGISEDDAEFWFDIRTL